MEYKNTDTGFYEPVKGKAGALQVTIAGADSTSGAVNTNIKSSEIIQAMEIQSRLSSAIQTHAGVSVAPTTGFSDSAWIDTEGFDKVSLSMSNDASTASAMNVLWSNDQSTIHGGDWGVMSGTAQQKSVTLDTKLRWMKTRLLNTDAAPHSMNAFAYLKA